MKVVIVGEFSQASRRQIRSVFPTDWQLVFVTPDGLDAEIGDTEVIIPEHVRIDGPFLKRAQHLQLVQTGAGFDNVDIEACTAGGVTWPMPPGLMRQPSLSTCWVSSFAGTKT